MSPGVPDGEAVVLDVGQLQSLLAKTFNVGLDVGRGKEPVALVRLRLAKALIGVAEANALAAESIAIERGIGTEDIAQTEALALHAAAFNGMPDPGSSPGLATLRRPCKAGPSSFSAAVSAVRVAGSNRCGGCVTATTASPWPSSSTSTASG